MSKDDDDAFEEEVKEIKAEPARMASQPRRAPRSTHLEVPHEPLSPGSASSSSSKSDTSKSSTSSSSGNSSSSESDESAEKSPVQQKGVLKAAKTEALEKGKEKARPHFLVETHGRSPSKLPTGQTRQEKFTGSAHHARSIEILKKFFNNEYGYSLGTFVHHYKNCCAQLKAATGAEGMRVHNVQFAVHGGFPCVPGDRRSCSARPIRCARRLRMCTWRHACRSARVSCPAVRQDLGLAATMLSRAEPRTIQAVLSCGTKNCSSVTKAVEHFQTLYPTAGAEGAAKSILRRVGDCVSGCGEAGEFEAETQSPNPGVSRWQAFLDERLAESSALEAGLESRGRRCRTSQASTSRM